MVKLDGVAVSIALREDAEWVSKGDGKRYTEGNWMSGYSANAIVRVGTGLLELNASYKHSGYGRENWRDGKRKPLEGRLGSFVVGLIKIVHELRREKEAAERRRQEEALRNRLEEEARQQAAEERERVRFIEGQLRDRRVAREIREYVAEVQAVLDDAGLGCIEHSELAEHLRWAAEHADALDPVTKARQSIREGWRGCGRPLLQIRHPNCQDRCAVIRGATGLAQSHPLELQEHTTRTAALEAL